VYILRDSELVHHEELLVRREEPLPGKSTALLATTIRGSNGARKRRWRGMAIICTMMLILFWSKMTA
jgi:hypothetical protein